jgi:SPX domain protein involved in polyphosphate accumulation
MSAVQSCFQRIEKKYPLTAAQYHAMLSGMRAHMRPDRYSRYTLCNVYYDTPSYDLIRTSLEKPVYKEKLRLRSYGTPRDGDRVFVELKKKFEGVVYKRRITLTAAEAPLYLAGKALQSGSQISREIDWFMHTYRPDPAVMIAYDREAYAGRENSELRITFDTGIRWRNTEVDLRCGDSGSLLLPRGQHPHGDQIPGAARCGWPGC